MASGGRWTIVMVILALAGIVALWPRGGHEYASPPSDQGSIDATPSAGPPEEDAALAPLRRRAALSPCPYAGQDAGGAAGPLAGVTTRCLGAPGAVDLGAALAGKATLLNLWASWCVPCREEMPVLADYAERPGSIPVLGVNVKEPASVGLEFMAEIGVRYPSLYDGEGAAQQALRVPPVLPVNYLVRPDGAVEHITDPLVFRSPYEIQTAVERLLNRSP